MGKFNFGEDDFNLDKKKGVAKTEVEQVVESNVKAGPVQNTSIQQPSGMAGTRGRKGCKLPTMNMRFSEENYEYMRREGAARGMTATGFVNWLIETYRSNPAHVTYNNSFKDNEGWD